MPFVPPSSAEPSSPEDTNCLAASGEGTPIQSNPFETQISRIQSLITKWSKLLKLQQWDSFVVIHTGDWDKYAEVSIVDEEQEYTIEILSEERLKEHDQNVEELVLHEMLHVFFHRLLTEGGKGKDKEEERIVRKLTKLLYKLNKEK